MFKDNIPERIHGFRLTSGKYVLVDDYTITLDEKDFVHVTSNGRRVSVNLDAIEIFYEATR